MPLGSASGVERLLACSASAVLPKARRTTKHAERGHGLHGFVRAVLTGTPPDAALSMVDEGDRSTARAIDFTQIGADLADIQCESAYAIDVRNRTSRLLGRNIQRGYAAFGLTEDHVPGSLDIEGVRPDGMPVVIDLKFGWERVTECEDNKQLATYATAIAWEREAPAVEARITYVRPDGSVHIDPHVFSALDIDSFADELEDGLDRVKRAKAILESGKMPTVSEGPHCKYCDAAHCCPAKTTLARSMLGDVESFEARLNSMTSEERGAAWIKLARVDAISDRIRSALRESAHHDWLVTSPGKVVRPIAYPQRKLDTEAALSLLRTKGASVVEIDRLYNTVQIDKVQETNDPRIPKVRKPRKKKSEAA